MREEADSLTAAAEDEHDFTWLVKLNAFRKTMKSSGKEEKVSEKN